MRAACSKLVRYRHQMKTSANKSTSVGQSGQSLVEIALLLPLILLLLLGVIEIGRYAYIGILVGNAARAGAAFAAQSLEDAAPSTPIPNQGVITAVNNDFQNNLPSAPSLKVSVTNSCGCDNGGSVVDAQCNGTETAGTCPTGQHWVVMVSVTCSGTFNALFNYPGIPKSIDVSRTATLRVAQK